MANWSAKTKILFGLILILAIVIVVWFIMSSRQTELDPEAILAELTLGEIANSETISLPDPSLDSAVSYLVASDSEAALQTGISIIRSKQQIIDYYTEWFRDNEWNVRSSVQAQSNIYSMSAQKAGSGTMQINIITQTTDFQAENGDDHSEFSGPINVLIIYGHGR